jgi:hypothetical protein
MKTNVITTKRMKEWNRTQRLSVIFVNFVVTRIDLESAK